MIVVDTSAWVELGRGTGSRVHQTLRARLTEDAELAVTEIVVMELLAGARSEPDEATVRDVLAGIPVLPLDGIIGFERAVELYQACRRAGETLRQLVDCLVAVPTIEHEATLLTADRDFEILARHTPLRLERLDA